MYSFFFKKNKNEEPQDEYFVNLRRLSDDYNKAVSAEKDRAKAIIDASVH